MKSFMLGAAIAASVLACSTFSMAGEPIDLNYTYTGDTGVNLSSIIGGPLTVNTFSDDRPDSAANDIQQPGKDALTLKDQTVASLLQTALAQSLEASGAPLGDANAPLSLEGKVIEMQLSETAQGLEALIRVDLTLRNKSRSAWQSVVFSRVQSDSSDPIAAISLGLDQLVAELFRDDYFLMELGIF